MSDWTGRDTVHELLRGDSWLRDPPPPTLGHLGHSQSLLPATQPLPQASRVLTQPQMSGTLPCRTAPLQHRLWVRAALRTPPRPQPSHSPGWPHRVLSHLTAFARAGPGGPSYGVLARQPPCFRGSPGGAGIPPSAPRPGRGPTSHPRNSLWPPPGRSDRPSLLPGCGGAFASSSLPWQSPGREEEGVGSSWCPGFGQNIWGSISTLC